MLSDDLVDCTGSAAAAASSGTASTPRYSAAALVKQRVRIIRCVCICACCVEVCRVCTRQTCLTVMSSINACQGPEQELFTKILQDCQTCRDSSQGSVCLFTTCFFYWEGEGYRTWIVWWVQRWLNSAACTTSQKNGCCAVADQKMATVHAVGLMYMQSECACRVGVAPQSAAGQCA